VFTLLLLATLQGSLLSSEDVCAAVFEQWLVANLSDIGASCLPPDVVSQPKYSLTGCYGLQVGFYWVNEDAIAIKTSFCLLKTILFCYY